MWAYVSEWLVVSSVAIMAGFILWSLMIHRRAYKPAKVTRLRLAILDEGL